MSGNSMMKTKYLQHMIILFILFECKGLLCQHLPYFKQKILQIEGQVFDIYLRDLNGDSHLDILVVHNKSQFPNPHVDRYISIFFKEKGLFPDRPAQTLTVDHGEILFDIGDLDGDAIPELVFLTRDGIYVRKHTPAGYSQSLQPVLKVSSVFLAHDPFNLHRWSFIRDLDGNTAPEFLIPRSHELRIYSKRPNIGYDLTQRFGTSPEFSLSSGQGLTSSLQLPTFCLQDFNGDSIQDLLALSEDRLDVYLLHPGDSSGFTIPLIPPNLKYRMGSRNMNPSALESLAPGSSIVETQDLNADGLVDIILSKSSRASFTTNISQLQIFMNKNRRFDILPDQILTAENFGGEHIIRDFNRDGLLDIALLRFKIGFAQAIKFLLTKKAGNSYDCYFMRPNFTYPNKPDARLSFSRKVKIDDILGSGLCQSFDGDFNGDGLFDLLLGTDSDEFTVYPGSPGAFFTKKSSFKIHVPISSHLRIGDINEDGFSDIILWYPQNTTRSHQFLLIRSEKGPSQ